jgi:hypothetical protein
MDDDDDTRRMLLPVTDGKSNCRWCHIEMAYRKWMLCESCEREAICWQCGAVIGEYRPDELCDSCYKVTPFHYRLQRKGRTYGTVAK